LFFDVNKGTFVEAYYRYLYFFDMKFIDKELPITAATALLSFATVAVGTGVFAGKAQALQFSFSYNYENLSASGIFETTDNFSQYRSFDAYRILGISNGSRNGAIIDLLPPDSYMTNDNFLIPQLTFTDQVIGPFFTDGGFSFLADNKTYTIYSNGYRLIESEARPDGGIGPNNFITNFSVTPVPEPTTLLGYLVGGAMVFWKKRKS
jgi:hypothetical protein